MNVLPSKIFEIFRDSLFKKVCYNVKDHKIIYLIVDRFLKDSLKGKIREERRIGYPCSFDDSTKLSAKFHFIRIW